MQSSSRALPTVWQDPVTTAVPPFARSATLARALPKSASTSSVNRGASAAATWPGFHLRSPGADGGWVRTVASAIARRLRKHTPQSLSPRMPASTTIGRGRPSDRQGGGERLHPGDVVRHVEDPGYAALPHQLHPARPTHPCQAPHDGASSGSKVVWKRFERPRRQRRVGRLVSSRQRHREFEVTPGVGRHAKARARPRELQVSQVAEWIEYEEGSLGPRCPIPQDSQHGPARLARMDGNARLDDPGLLSGQCPRPWGPGSPRGRARCW